MTGTCNGTIVLNQSAYVIIFYMGIGKVIYKKRIDAGLTREQLAAGICTEKHLYFLEKGLRNPSIQMLRNLSIKLDYNLFDYLGYEDCTDPCQTKSYVEDLKSLRARAQFKDAWDLAEEAAQTDDFKSLPGRYLIDIIKALKMIFVDWKIKEAQAYILEALDSSEKEQCKDAYCANLKGLLAATYFYLKDYKKALTIIEEADRQVKDSDLFSDFAIATLSIKRIKISILIFNERLDDAINEAKKLLQDIESMPFTESKSYIYFPLALAYFLKSDMESAEYWLERVFSDLLLINNENTAFYIFSYSEFNKVLQASNIPESRFAVLEQNYGNIIEKYIRKESV